MTRYNDASFYNTNKSDVVIKFLKKEGVWEFIPSLDDIIRFESEKSYAKRNNLEINKSDGNYTRIILKNQRTFTLSKSIGKYSKLLKNYGFIRTHDQHIINVANVQIHDTIMNYFLMDDGFKVPIASRRIAEINRNPFIISL